MKHQNISNTFYWQAILIFVWVCLLMGSDAYYAPYLVVYAGGAIGLWCNRRQLEITPFAKNFYRKENRPVSVLTILLAVLVTLANYRLWYKVAIPARLPPWFSAACGAGALFGLLMGGLCAFGNLFSAAVPYLAAYSWPRDNSYKRSPRFYFFVSFGIMAAVYLVILFACHYPGSLAWDSACQIWQGLSSCYSNHHPFYHTKIIGLCISLGQYLFNDIHAAVAVFSVFQVLFMSLCFAAMIYTMVQIYLPRWMVALTLCSYALLPHHIMLSFTMLKDIMFSGLALLFILYLFRVMYGVGDGCQCVGKNWRLTSNYVILGLSALGIGLLRSNGVYVLALFLLVFSRALVKRLANRAIPVACCFIALVAFVLSKPVISYMKIPQPDLAEHLSIPIQQLTRVVVDGGKFSQKDGYLIDKVAPRAKIKQEYKYFISDPIKNLIRRHGNQSYLARHKLAYARLYLKIGLRYPFVYLRAWVDQTRGYYNSGYTYHRWFYSLTRRDGMDRDPGFHRVLKLFPIGAYRPRANVAFLAKASDAYLWLYENNHALRLLISIGFYVWLNLALLAVSYAKGDLRGRIICCPTLLIIATLLISTPVAYEFRYAYAVFCALPCMIMAVFYKGRDTDECACYITASHSNMPLLATAGTPQAVNVVASPECGRLE